MAVLSTGDLAEDWIHTVTVKTYLGASAYGDRFANPTPPVPCLVEDDVRLVRDADGNEVVSSTTVYADLGKAGLFRPGSLVTTPAGREARVIGLAQRDAGDPDLDHMEAHLS